jgi:hypothetical protein
MSSYEPVTELAAAEHARIDTSAAAEQISSQLQAIVTSRA